MSPYYAALYEAVEEIDAPVILEASGKNGERIAEARMTTRGILWDGSERLKIFELYRTDRVDSRLSGKGFSSTGQRTTVSRAMFPRYFQHGAVVRETALSRYR
jgi:hypothetical protein